MVKMNIRASKHFISTIVLVGFILVIWHLFKDNVVGNVSPHPMNIVRQYPYEKGYCNFVQLVSMNSVEESPWKVHTYHYNDSDSSRLLCAMCVNFRKGSICIFDTTGEVTNAEINLFEASLQRHFKRKDKKLTSSLPVAWTYQSYNVTGNLTCWSESKFAPTFEENKRIVQQYPNGTSLQYLTDLGLLKPYKSKTVPRLPVYVTGASSNHYLESQAMLRDFHSKVLSKYKDVKLVYYDIGLTDTERDQVKRYCRCEVRIFPFDKYPPHVQHLTGYTWKVLIIQILLNEFGYVFWLDTSMRFKDMNLFAELEVKVSKYGVASWDFGYSLAVTIDPDTYHFLREDPCLFVNKPSAGTGGILVKRSDFTLEYIMRPWVSCALTFGCMVNNRSRQLFQCPAPNNWVLGACQRYEQAVLSIILWRLYGRYDVVMFPKDFVETNRGDVFQYFSLLEHQKATK